MGTDTDVPEVIETKDIQIIQKSPMELSTAFISNGGTVETLKEILALQKEYDAMEAKKAYTKAIADFKSTPLSILKDKVNNQFGSKYVSIGQLVNCALPGMGKYGLSHKWEIDQTDQKSIKVTCVVTHSDGHSESVSMAAPPDTSGGNSKNAIQQIKSTITYLRAATFEGIMGLASTDANINDDGNMVGVKLVTTKQVSSIVDMINSTGIDETAFLKWVGVDQVEAIPVTKFNEVMVALKGKVKK